MDMLEGPYWSRLQVELWVCTRSMGAVALADANPGRIRIADLSLGSDGLDDEALDADRPAFADEAELIGTAIIKYGSLCPFDDAQRGVIAAVSEGKLREHRDPSSGVRFFKAKEVRQLWPVRGPLRLRKVGGPLTLAAAVTAIAYGRELTSDALAERRRRHGGRWPAYLQKKLDQASNLILEMITTHSLPAYGFAGERDDGTGRAVRRGDMVPIVNDEAFLAHRLWAVSVRSRAPVPNGSLG